VRQVQLTPREDEEYQWAQDTRLNQYYNKEVVGLNDELNDVGLDKHSNPSGSSFDLGQDGQFSEFTVLIGGFVSGASMNNPVQALKKKGFQVILENSEKGFLSQLKIADVAWVISGTDPDPKPSPTSSKESYPAWKSVNRKEFQEEINKYHKSGGGLFLWGDNDPLFEHANAALQRIFQDEEMVLIGNTPANKILDVGDGKLTGQFHPHIITSGIVKLYEGVTICYPKKHPNSKSLQHPLMVIQLFVMLIMRFYNLILVEELLLIVVIPKTISVGMKQEQQDISSMQQYGYLLLNID